MSAGEEIISRYNAHMSIMIVSNKVIVVNYAYGELKESFLKKITKFACPRKVA